MMGGNKILGAILLIAGTSIGAGMLALPVTTGFAGFFPTLVLLFFLWAYMLLTAFLFLEVNLAFPGNINLITMASNTLGVFGKAVAWIGYLLLFYSLTAAYLAGSAPLLGEAIRFLTGYTLPKWSAPLLLLFIFGFFTYLGSKPADYLNRILMTGLVAAYLILSVFLPSNVNFDLLKHVDLKAIWVGLPLIITSFGFHSIIPTITNYLRHDVKKLKIVLVIGSFIPLLIYGLWEFLVLGIVKLQGSGRLSQMYVEGQPSTKALFDVLIHVLNKPFIATAAGFFSFFAIITSFIGVTLGLADFITDGFNIKRNKKGRVIACLLTFLPPLLFLYEFQIVFVQALQYAAIFVAILLCVLPALMILKVKDSFFSKTFLGKALVILVILIAVAIIALDIAQQMGLLKNLTAKYLTQPI